MRHNRILPWTNITTEDTRPVWHICKVPETQGKNAPCQNKPCSMTIPNE